MTLQSRYSGTGERTMSKNGRRPCVCRKEIIGVAIFDGTSYYHPDCYLRKENDRGNRRG